MTYLLLGIILFIVVVKYGVSLCVFAKNFFSS